MTRRGGGREARVHERTHSHIDGPAFIRRKVRAYDLLTPDGLDLIESKADQLLAEVGIDINEAEDRELFRQAGASVDGNRVRFEPGHVRELASTAPSQFTQHARNPLKSVEIEIASCSARRARRSTATASGSNRAMSASSHPRRRASSPSTPATR